MLAAGLLATPATAADTAPAAKKFDFDRLAYATVMRAGAVESYVDIPRRTIQNFGFSSLDLRKDIG